MDTTVSEAKQKQWSGVDSEYRGNVFKGGHTYYTFLLYGSPGPEEGAQGPPATSQTYEIYVGKKDFNEATDVFPVRAKVEKIPFEWPAADIPEKNFHHSYDPNVGILTVTLGLDFADFKANYKSALKDKCQPPSFCSWTPDNNGGGTCGCALNDKDKLWSQCDKVCSTWTNKDVDCPTGGCYGFGVKLPEGFENNDQAVPPEPTCYPKDDNWNVKFKTADSKKAGSCEYKTPPPGGVFCTGSSQ
jgi:hypothetical protein